MIGLAFNPQSQAYEVISVNPTTGSITSLIRALSGVQYLGSGEAAAGNDIYFTGGAIVTDPMTGVGGFGPESLFTADISTGALTSVPVPQGFALNSVDSTTGKVIGLAFNPQSQAYEVISVNPTTGSVTSLIRALSGVQYLGSGEAAAGNDIYFTGGAIVTDPMTGVGGFGPESLFTADISTGALTSVPVPNGFELGPSNPVLFTTGSEAVDFNNLTDAQEKAIATGAAAIYNGLGGGDVVTLPDIANYTKNPLTGQTLNWIAGTIFHTGDTAGQDYTIIGGDGKDSIQLGDGNDVVFGSPGNDTVSGDFGQDTFDYQTADYPSGSNQDFGDFNGFSAGTQQTITGGHTTFQTELDQTERNQASWFSRRLQFHGLIRIGRPG